MTKTLKEKAAVMAAIGAVTAGTVLSASPASAASYDIRVAANAPLWSKVPVDGRILGRTDGNGSDALATCKRWSADIGAWYYWVKHDDLRRKGYVLSHSTNLTHSHLKRCR
ncbi:hypothetical protein ABGB12_01390 [Actinocorallia sp. B10E7]|uniref:hypothetical protein n=1 Tax=Actinocorallia sp. B10E7 TaxID=3153558 RepID=UPI00325DB849